MRWLFWLLVISVCVLPAGAQDTLPVFEPQPCPGDLVPGRAVECGFLIVREDRHDPDNLITLKLAVLIVHSPDDGQRLPDPVVYLVGGPGGSAVSSISQFNQRFAAFADRRDFILIDQRGTGSSLPRLDCPEFLQYMAKALVLDLSVQEEIEMAAESVRACADRLAAGGVNLQAYNSAASAADIHDLRLALGYDQVNLFGTSYGTRLALTVMRDYPEDVRSVILGSVYPPQVNLFVDAPANTRRVLNVLFEGCAADPVCHQSYPDLEAVFYDLVESLNADPLFLVVADPFTLTRLNALVSGDELVTAVFFALYSTRTLPQIPRMIYETRDGRYEMLSSYLTNSLAPYGAISIGMYLSVECHEEVPFNTRAELASEFAAFPPLRSYFERTGDFNRLCAEWDAGQANPIENEPVTSDIPALLLAGQYDPVTPPSWAVLAAQTLTRSFVYEFPGFGHDVAVQPCPTGIIREFLDDPYREPDSSCIADLAAPTFLGPRQ